MRIVAGNLRGRRIAVPDGDKTRPTSDRARQALFNILEHGSFSAAGSALVGARVLDGFAGTGALGLEAISRGAASVIFIENDPVALRALKQNIRTMGVAAQSILIGGDACRPPPPPWQVDLVLLDPPYGAGLGVEALRMMAAGGWLAPDAAIVVEVAARETFVPPAFFTIADERRYGAARLVFGRVENGGMDPAAGDADPRFTDGQTAGLRGQCNRSISNS